jgi:allantoicase
MKAISGVYIISALKVFQWNKDYYLVNEKTINEDLADINKPILLLSNGKIIDGWETLKYVLNSKILTNVYYQIVERE